MQQKQYDMKLITAYKICNQCNQSKPLFEFQKRKDGKHGVRAQCKNCLRALRSTKWITNKNVKIRQTERNRNKYTEEWYLENSHLTKVCSTCKTEKLLVGYRNEPNGINGKRSICLKCERLKNNEYKKALPPPTKEQRVRMRKNSSNHYFKHKSQYRARDAKRRSDLANRTPSWANLEAIQKIYDEARRISDETGIPHHVDHIIPLHGVNVSGLHVHNNLQIITAHENKIKSNKFQLC